MDFFVYYQQNILENWSVPELKRQKESGLFMRFALSKGKDEILKLSRHGQLIEKPEDIVRCLCNRRNPCM
jgi:predicted nuclease of restriction endonuclease-like (RecB) superfamily